MEWDEGKKLAHKLLLTKESAQMYAERLTELAAALNFDGWLVNMEVTLDPIQIPNLKEFVRHLSQTMHSSVPGSTVIWYDSVTVDGNLSWQNQLNDKNKPFFDICDGIFLNYSWKVFQSHRQMLLVTENLMCIWALMFSGGVLMVTEDGPQMLRLMSSRKMKFQQLYLLLDGSTRQSNHLTLKQLKIAGGDLLRNPGGLYKTIPSYFPSTQILTGVMVTIFMLMGS